MKLAYFGFLLVGLLPGLLTTADPERDAARKVFAESVAKAFNIPLRKITVPPVYTGLPDNPYADQKNSRPFSMKTLLILIATLTVVMGTVRAETTFAENHAASLLPEDREALAGEQRAEVRGRRSECAVSSGVTSK